MREIFSVWHCWVPRTAIEGPATLVSLNILLCCVADPFCGCVAEKIKHKQCTKQCALDVLPIWACVVVRCVSSIESQPLRKRFSERQPFRLICPSLNSSKRRVNAGHVDCTAAKAGMFSWRLESIAPRQMKQNTYPHAFYILLNHSSPENAQIKCITHM